MSGGMMEEQLKALMAELSATLADMVVAMQSKSDGTNEISATLADMVAAIEANKAQPLDALVQAIKAIRVEAPAVTVNVTPTPIQNIVQPAPVQILERVQPGDYKMTVKYDNHDRIVEALIKRVEKS